MPNENLYRGSDAVLILAVDDKSTVDGALADATITEYDMSSIVGHLTSVRLQVVSDVRPYHEIGKRYPSELRHGDINVSGTATKAHVNGSIIKLLLGDGAVSPPPSQTFSQPVFNMVLNVKNPSIPQNSSTITVFGVKLTKWELQLDEDEYILENIEFKALRMTTEEVSG